MGIIRGPNFSWSTWFCLWKIYAETGRVSKPKSLLRGRKRILQLHDIDYLLVRQNPYYFLHEFLSLLDTNRFISVHYTTIFKELEHAYVS